MRALSGVRRDILVHLLVERASCSSLLKVDLGLSHASVHRELGVLVGLELVRRVVPRRNGRGRPFAIYAVQGYTADDVVRVVEWVSRMRTPAYSRVRVISQLILGEYLEPWGLREITYREVVRARKAISALSRCARDVDEQVLTYVFNINYTS